jgi:hypothetical protein
MRLSWGGTNCGEADSYSCKGSQPGASPTQMPVNVAVTPENLSTKVECPLKTIEHRPEELSVGSLIVKTMAKKKVPSPEKLQK